MDTQRWINQAHPQTLLFATFLLYFDAFFAALNLLLGGGASLLGLLIAGSSVAAGFGIANDRNWGYYLGVGVSAIGLLLLLVFTGLGNFLGLMFAVAQVALLVHPQSREYQRIWFR